MTQDTTFRWRDIALLSLISLIAYLPGLAALPPIDRDEARYVQATVQMIETGDLIDIRFQDEARYKKPAGAYWAQLASLMATGQIDDVKRGERAIWAHRLPSVLGALIAVWATYLCGLALFGRRDAFVGAGFLAVSISLVFEAHIAKTDALLAGASAVVLYGLSTQRAWPTWLGLAAGTLVKGPILLGVASLALLIDVLWNRNADRLRAVTRPLPIVAGLFIAAPWFIAIGLKTDGAFFAEALGQDFGGKITSTQETHGGPPGYYLLTSLAMFWPGILAVPVTILFAWRNRSKIETRWLIAWLLPMWIGLELVPTKLPHYTLPLYPALALLAGAGWVRIMDSPRLRANGLILAGTIALLLSLIVAITSHEGGSSMLPAIFAVSLAALAFGSLLAFKTANETLALAMAGLFLGCGFAILSRSPQIDLSRRLMAEIPSDAKVVSPDYREPSLIFLAGTDTELSRNADPGNVLVLGQHSTPPDCADRSGSVSGTNYAKGQQLVLSLYRTHHCTRRNLSVWAREAGKS